MAQVEDKDIKYIFKVVLTGDSGVGKSKILTSYITGEFADDNVPTIGVDFRVKRLFHNNQGIKLQVWDTAGQERYRAIAKSYYREATGVILVYDVTQRETFDHLDNWLQEARSCVNESTPFIIIGNKTDLESSRAVSMEEGQALSEKHKITFMETSAKNFSTIDSIFQEIIKDMCIHAPEESYNWGSVRAVKVGDRAPRARAAACC